MNDARRSGVGRTARNRRPGAAGRRTWQRTNPALSLLPYSRRGPEAQRAAPKSGSAAHKARSPLGRPRDQPRHRGPRGGQARVAAGPQPCSRSRPDPAPQRLRWSRPGQPRAPGARPHGSRPGRCSAVCSRNQARHQNQHLDRLLSYDEALGSEPNTPAFGDRLIAAAPVQVSGCLRAGDWMSAAGRAGPEQIARESGPERHRHGASGRRGSMATLVPGTVAALGTGRWNRLSLSLHGSAITAAADAGRSPR